ELIEQGVLDRHLATLKAEHRRRRDAMVQALRQEVPAAQLRFGVPDGGMYLWCELPPTIRARAVQEHALRESVMVLTGDPFYVDQGGANSLRFCYPPQPASRAEQIAKTLARSLAAAQRAGVEPPPA